MWWLSLNLLPLFNILVASTALPHHTVTFKLVFEFIVLGVVPGTAINLNFVDSLFIWLIVLSAFLLHKSFKDTTVSTSFFTTNNLR